MAVDSIIYGYIVKEELFKPNSIIIEEGRRGDWVSVVLEGRVKIKKRTPKGMVTIDTLGQGAIIGDMTVFKGEGLRTASVIADGEAKLGILDSQRLEKDYESLSPELKSLVKTMVLRLEEANRKASLLAVQYS
jgi:CRP-like cAMP-binding protein